MKKIKLLLLILFAFMATTIANNKDSDPSMDFRFANEQVVEEGGTYYFMFDVQVRASVAGTFHRDMQVYFDYNPAVFGNSIKANDKITVEKIGIMAEEFSGIPKYIWVNEGTPQGYGTDNTPSRYYITSESSFSTTPANEMFHTEVPTDWAGYMRAKIEITNFGHPAGIQLISSIGNTTFMDGGQYYQSETAQPVVYATPYGYINNLMEYIITSGEPAEYTLVVDINGNGGVLVDGLSYTIPLIFEEGTVVNLQAVPDSDWEFTGWTGDLTSANVNETITMDGDKFIEANFTEIPPQIYLLTLLVNPEGAGEVTGAGEYEEGEIASVDAVANEGWVFVNWTDTEDNVIFEMPANDIPMTENLTLVANFVEEFIPDTYTLTLMANPEGAGEVFGAGEYEEGEFASVNAVANEGWVFVNWTDTEDNIVSETPANDIPMTADLTLIANFEEVPPPVYTLTLLVNPEGAGEVFGAGEYEEGEIASVDAVPNEGWVFVNWTDP
ncbi:MAG: InlB B-repeat-containing protein, partial [Bacteroidota bacterium]